MLRRCARVVGPLDALAVRAAGAAAAVRESWTRGCGWPSVAWEWEDEPLDPAALVTSLHLRLDIRRWTAAISPPLTPRLARDVIAAELLAGMG